jgi:hypothetical protein
MDAWAAATLPSSCGAPALRPTNNWARAMPSRRLQSTLLLLVVFMAFLRGNGSSSSSHSSGNHGTGAAAAASRHHWLNLLPAAPVARQLYYNTSLVTWGGSVLRADDGEYHLYAAAFGLGCNLGSWHSNSFVVHGVSDVAAGPYSWHDVALPMEHHNPHALRAPDGTYLIYSHGQGNCNSDMDNSTWAVPDCGGELPGGGRERVANATTPYCTHNCVIPGCQSSLSGDGPVGPYNQGPSARNRIELHYSSSANGPWKRLTPTPDLWDGAITRTRDGQTTGGASPAALFHPSGNGSVILMLTPAIDRPLKHPLWDKAPMEVWTANHWKGPYHQASNMSFAPCNACSKRNCRTCAECDGGTCGHGLEDPTFFWDHADQKYKALFHGGATNGAFAQSRTADFFGDWDYNTSNTGAYNNRVELEGGGEIALSRRERPKVYIENGSLQLLINGVCFNGSWQNCSTFAQPVNQSHPWLVHSKMVGNAIDEAAVP